MPETLTPETSRFFPTIFISADGKSLTAKAYAFLVLLCIAFFIPGLATLPPTDRDESSFAQASKQMIETGNYVDIRLQDKPRYKKPIGIYWLQAASVKLFNSHRLNEIWAYRIPSIVGATTAVVMTAALGSLLFSPMVGFLAALMMAACVVLNVEARLAKTDAALLSSIMVMQYALARAYLSKNMNWRMAALFWTALGIGLLIKGPIILLVLFSTLLWLRLTDKNLQWLNKLKPWAGLPYLLLITVPWFVAIALQSHGGFVAESAGHDLFAKLWQGQDRGMLPPGLHLIALPLVFFPSSLFVLLAIPDIWQSRKKTAVKFCLGWIIPTWIVFELSLTKLPHYTLPLYPALALLAAKALVDGYPVLAERGGSWLTTSIIALWMTLGMGFAVAFALTPYITDHHWSLIQIIAAVILIVTQGVCLFLLFKRKVDSVIALTFGSLLFIGCTLGGMLPSLQHLWVSRQIIAVAETLQSCDLMQIISASYGEPSLVFLAGTNTIILPDGGAAARAMKHNACSVGVIDDKQKQAFLDSFTKNEIQPAPMGKVEGLNIGHGHSTEITLYLLPNKPLSQ